MGFVSYCIVGLSLSIIFTIIISIVDSFRIPRLIRARVAEKKANPLPSMYQVFDDIDKKRKEKEKKKIEEEEERYILNNCILDGAGADHIEFKVKTAKGHAKFDYTLEPEERYKTIELK